MLSGDFLRSSLSQQQLQLGLRLRPDQSRTKMTADQQTQHSSVSRVDVNADSIEDWNKFKTAKR